MKLNMKSIKFAIFALVLSMASCQTEAQNYKTVDIQTFENGLTTPNIQVLDVRTPDEFAKGHIEAAKNVDWNNANFESNIASLDKNKPVYIYCLGGGRSKKAALKMTELGFKNIVELEGGYMNWSKNHADKNAKSQYTLETYTQLTKSNAVVVVDFYADWCAPCKKMAPYIAKLQKEYEGKAAIVKIDADQNKPLFASLNYMGLPVVVIYKNGVKVYEQEGFVSEEQMREQLTKLL